MPIEKFLKMTFNDGVKKHNVYLKMPSPTFAVLKREITMSLFEERNLPKCDLKIYWIDEDGDEIEIFNQSDYEIFLSKRSERQHLHVESIKAESEEVDKLSTTGKDGMPEDDPSAFVIHDRVECDGCNVAPIVGFRYKCIQCPNYDLCQRCEAQHKHHEHMMVRLPRADAPTVVDAWVTAGRWGRRNSKRCGRSCPFMVPPVSAAQNASAATGDENAESEQQHYHRRKHHRRVRNGIFSNLYDMMQDLAEGGAAHRTEESNEAAETATAQNAANEAANVENAMQEAAAKAAQVAGKENKQTASAATVNQATAPSAPEEPTAAPRSPKQMEETVASSSSKHDEQTIAPKLPKPERESVAPISPTRQEEETTKADKPKMEAEPTIPVVPSLENLAQFIDPQYMRAGIQILNNFSEMFAKMIDPMDDGSGPGSSFQGIDIPKSTPPPSERKHSAASMASMSSCASSSAAAAAATAAAATAAAAAAAAASAATSSAAFSTRASSCTTPNADIVQTFLNDLRSAGAYANGASPKASDGQQAKNIEFDIGASTSTGERRPSGGCNSRDMSEESDWQVIDKQSAIDVSSSNESFGIELPASRASDIDTTAAEPTAAAAAVNSVEASMQLNFEQLSKDLRAHVEQERQHEAQVSGVSSTYSPYDKTNVTSTTDAAATTANNAAQTDNQTATATQTVVTPTASTAPASISIGTSTSTTANRRYHENDQINEAVIAMMSMGFSNEGAWLTQLLESVNGNISSALDIMSSAQRYRN